MPGPGRRAEGSGVDGRHCRGNTRQALELFDQLYASGKDVSALLDELCALARDLLVLKTAPKAGLSMLSGVSTQEEAVSLRDRLSTGELIRILKTLQQTAAGFTRVEKPVGWGAVLNSPLRTGLKPGTGGHKRPPHPSGGSSCLRSQAAPSSAPGAGRGGPSPARRSGSPPGDFRGGSRTSGCTCGLLD